MFARQPPPGGGLTPRKANGQSPEKQVVPTATLTPVSNVGAQESSKGNAKKSPLQSTAGVAHGTSDEVSMLKHELTVLENQMIDAGAANQVSAKRPDEGVRTKGRGTEPAVN
jgi:hypothetical protein